MLANIPIARDPIIPAMPCTELTSNASSIFSLSFRKITPKYDAIPTADPIAKACSTLTDPDIGVIPARPAMAPFIADCLAYEFSSRKEQPILEDFVTVFC